MAYEMDGILTATQRGRRPPRSAGARSVSRSEAARCTYDASEPDQVLVEHRLLLPMQGNDAAFEARRRCFAGCANVSGGAHGTLALDEPQSSRCTDPRLGQALPFLRRAVAATIVGRVGQRWYLLSDRRRSDDHAVRARCSGAASLAGDDAGLPRRTPAAQRMRSTRPSRSRGSLPNW